MTATADKSDPKLWDKVKQAVTRADKGGKPGQWSARKAQIAVQDYKAKGGGYKGGKSADNHLAQWTHEEWGTKSGAPSGETGERYLPRQAREALSDEQYTRTTRKKQADTRRGKQFSAQPKDVARKTAELRHPVTKASLMKQASERGIAGRSRMNKAALIEALQLGEMSHPPQTPRHR